MASARGRLPADLARHVRLAHTNLEQGFKALLRAEKEMDGMYHRACSLFGGWPHFAPEHRKDAESQVAGLSDRERGDRVRLPSELLAALDEPRRPAQGAVGKQSG